MALQYGRKGCSPSGSKGTADGFEATSMSLGDPGCVKTPMRIFFVESFFKPPFEIAQPHNLTASSCLDLED